MQAGPAGPGSSRFPATGSREAVGEGAGGGRLRVESLGARRRRLQGMC
jgi:hypothetical protein